MYVTKMFKALQAKQPTKYEQAKQNSRVQNAKQLDNIQKFGQIPDYQQRKFLSRIQKVGLNSHISIEWQN